MTPRSLVLDALTGALLLLPVAACSSLLGLDRDYTDASNGSEAGAAAETGGSGDGSGGKTLGGASSGGTANASGGTSSAGGSAGSGAGGADGDCEGALSGGICWYLGEQGESCTESCTAHGGEAPGVSSIVGTASQGGSLEKCGEVLSALGRTLRPAQASRFDGSGIGCHVYNTTNVWLEAPAYKPTSSNRNARIACGCLR